MERWMRHSEVTARFGEYEYQATGSKSEDPDFSAPRIKEVIPQASGKIIVIAQTFAVGFVGGAQRDVVFWLNEDGTLDASNGIPFSERVGELLGSMPRAAAVGPDGSIYMVGQAIVGSDDFGTSRKYAGYIMKRTTLGYPAPSFGLNFSPGGGEPRPGIRIWNPKGSPPQSAVSSFKILKSGKVLVGGHVNNRMFVSRLNSHGKLDRSFGPWRGKGKRNRGMTIVNFGGTNPVGRTLQTRRIPFATPKQSLLAELGHDRPESPLGLFKPNGTIAQRSPRLRIELLEQVLNNGAQVR